jgi:hypothetical protein
MSVAADSRPRPPWSGDAGAARLFAHVRAACQGGEDLPARLESGLRSAFGMLAADPQLAYELTVAPYLGAEAAALDGLREWLARFGCLMNDAAAEDPRARKESTFIAPYLIGGVRLQIARLVLNGEGAELLRLLPGNLEGLRNSYLGPDGCGRLAPFGRDG